MASLGGHYPGKAAFVERSQGRNRSDEDGEDIVEA